MTDDLKELCEYLATELHGWESWDDDSSTLPQRGFPGYLLTGNGAMDTLERMRERGCSSVVQLWADGECTCTVWSDDRMEKMLTEVTSNTLPEAITRAAVAALKGDRDE